MKNYAECWSQQFSAQPLQCGVLAIYQAPTRHSPGLGIVTKSVNRGALVDAALFEGRAEGVLHAALRHRLGCLREVDMVATFGGEDQDWITMRGPIVTEQFERALGQWNITVLVALAVADMDHHPRAVDVWNCEADAFLQTQPAGIDGRETDAIAQ